MGALQNALTLINGYLWGWPTIIMLIGVGVYLTIILGAIQFKHLLPALTKAFSKKSRQSRGKGGSLTNFQALMTALCATVGTGNIAGVATAIAIGGPGAIFWMWITGLLGMVTKYTEAFLGVHYRVQELNGTTSGGPMYYIQHGLKWPWLAKLFAIFLVFAALGIGCMVQSNSMADALQTTFNIAPTTTGIVISALVGLVILGGIKRIGRLAEKIVPTMILLYVGASLLVIALNISAVPSIFALIFDNAFGTTAAVGGFAGAALKTVMQMGFSRGIFSNESGMGSAPIAAATANTEHPAEQALISMTQTFIDTLVVCTMTALVILISGEWAAERAGSMGAALTTDAFAKTLPFMIGNYTLGALVVAISLVFFAFTTLIGWSYYGQKGLEFLFGHRVVVLYRCLFIGGVFTGAWLIGAGDSAQQGVALAWSFAEATTALMILPNLIALVLLAPKVKKLTKDYFQKQNGHQKTYKHAPFHEW